jgi:hypothetical protein
VLSEEGKSEVLRRSQQFKYFRRYHHSVVISIVGKRELFPDLSNNNEVTNEEDVP